MKNKRAIGTVPAGAIDLALVVLGLLCVAITFPWAKPIWGDEFLQFALGSCQSIADAWRTFLRTQDINHGQTGAYFVADYLLLHTFGASKFWMRFPSLISGIYLFFSSEMLLRRLKVPALWRVWGCLALFCQWWVMHFIGDARPYLPLAAASIGVLAYYCSSLEERRRFRVQTVGYAGVFLGALFHPYFSVYWMFAAVFGYLYCTVTNGQRMTVRGLLVHSNPLLCALGAGCYFLIGYPTWLTHHLETQYDPFEWIKLDKLIATFVNAHFKFLNQWKGPFLALWAVVIALGLKWGPLRKLRREIFFCSFLLAGGLALSILVSFASYRSHYWILQRQWVASVAITTIASTWMVSILSSALKGRARWGWVAAVFVYIVFHTWIAASQSIQDTQADLIASRSPVEKVSDHFSIDADGRELPTQKQQDAWADLANLNVRMGGPVWPVLMRYYSAP